MAGIAAFGSYLPWRRLNRASVVAANKWLNPGLASNARGTRAMAAWDEDSVTLSVEAARLALAGVDRSMIDTAFFASTTAPFADRQNCAVISTALGLREDIGANDVGGSQRAGTTALLGALNAVGAGSAQRALVCAGDRRKAPAGSSRELQMGDAGAAVLISLDDGVARYVGGGSMTIDFVDHYRETDRNHDYTWEERWIRDEGLMKIVPVAIRKTLDRTAVDPSTITHFIFPSSFRGADAQIAAQLGIAKDKVRDDLAELVGDTGVPHPLLMLNHVLEDAKPGERILLAGFGQGCDVLIFDITSARSVRPYRSLASQIASGKDETNYMRYLVFNDMIDWDKGKRAERDKQTALTTLYRNREMLTALVGGKCRICGTPQFPKVRVCVNPDCHGTDSQDPYSFADEPATITSWSGDHLVFTLDPPLHYGMVSFRSGGRIMVEFADCDPADITTGAPIRMAFRVKDFDMTRGFRRYFWKAVPERPTPSLSAGKR